MQYAVWLKAITYDLIVFPFLCLSSKELLRTGEERAAQVLPRHWRNEVVWAYANAWIFACQRDHSSLSGPLCFLLASSVVWGPFCCSGKSSGWDSPDNMVSPSSCWLQTLTRLSIPLLDQWVTPQLLPPDHPSLQSWPRGGPQPYNAAPMLPKNWRLTGKSTIRASLPNCKTKRLQQDWDCYPKGLLARLALSWHLWTWI